MSTTRHLVNRQRRLATAAAERAAAPARGHATPALDEPVPDPSAKDTVTDDEASDDADPAAGDEKAEVREKTEPGGTAPSRLRVRLPAVLCALTVLLGAFAAWAFTSAGSLRDDPSRQNTALTDIGRTSEVKGQIADAVGAVFSYNYASPANSEEAARTHLVGKAVQQHKDMLAQVRAQGQKQKLVLTTTVTDSGVELLDGDRARLLIFADQSNTRTGKSDETTYAAAMFAVDAVRRGDTWRISAIDTFTR
ncbi:hypothetical protein OOK13_05815 [Streptomyces sp. NBC_00378]|uniref:hypothetical protein n=1 Tax=unclassified Streptomyces TaxID=2593676 RepID=UPI002257ED85|nr:MULTISPECIES: hypothetical protein [unclassified Streptomyces]MCX5108041.1 hypothetical protein [Streptomyces sp. NBC_00378]